MKRSAQHEELAPKEYFKRAKEIKLVYFMIAGNVGGFEQIPPMFNAIENMTAKLNEEQTEIHYRAYSYGFDFKRQPNAYSGAILKDQAKFVAA
jgi:hypothetical protein